MLGQQGARIHVLWEHQIGRQMVKLIYLRCSVGKFDKCGADLSARNLRPRKESTPSPLDVTYDFALLRLCQLSHDVFPLGNVIPVTTLQFLYRESKSCGRQSCDRFMRLASVKMTA